MRAAGDVFNPDVEQRREWGKQIRRREKTAKRQRDEAARAGDRHPRAAGAAGVHDAERAAAGRRRAGRRRRDPAFRELVEPRHCYVCKQPYAEVHPFYDQLCPACGDLNYRKRTETADLDGARRAAHRRARQDRLPGRDQAAALRRAADRDDAVPARRRGPLRGGARLRRLARPARGLRARPAPHAERRGVLRAPRRDPRPARLHRQQRVPDRAPAAGVLPPHAGARDGRAGRPAGRGAPAGRAVRGPAPLRPACRPTASP